MSTITQKDVAEKAGVSRSTVRDVLNGHARVAEATRDRVMQAVRDLNYRPHSGARDLVLQRNDVKNSSVQPAAIDLWWDFMHDDFTHAIYNNLQAAFQEHCPQVKVRIAKDTQVGHLESVDRLLLALATGSSPACQYVGHPHFQKFVRLGLCADISELVNRWEEREQFIEPAWDVVRQEGRYYGIPTASASLAFLHANRTLLQRAGWKSAPTSWEELIECAKALTNPAEGRYGLSLPSLDGDLSYLFVDLLYLHGGAIRSASTNKWGLSLDEEPAVDALQLIHDLRWKHNVMPPQLVQSWSDMRRDFLNGRVAMTLSDLLIGRPGGIIQSLDEIELAALPSGPDGRRFSQLGIGTWIINAQCTPSQQNAAWEYIRFQASCRTLEVEAEVHEQQGLVYPLLATLRNCPQQQAAASGLPRGWHQVMSKAFSEARLVHYPSGYELETLRRLLLKVLTDPTADVRAVLREYLLSTN